MTYMVSAHYTAIIFIKELTAVISFKLSRTEPEYKRTRVLVQRMIRLTVETGVLTGKKWWRFLSHILKRSTAFVAILNILLVVAPKGHPQYYQVTSALLSKMYANTIMVILNSRIILSGTSHWDSKEEKLQVAALIFAPVEGLELTSEDSWYIMVVSVDDHHLHF